ncbi:MAG TPA: DUF4199 domain-containing protein [Bacteroidales bacterium]|nr:DUF4199 domain-containing protein [Bacteroidales bacterium]
MENQEISSNPGMAKTALVYGLIIGVFLIMASMGFYLAGAITSPIASYLSLLAVLVGIILATLSWRKEGMGGYISYGKAVGFGSLTILFASILAGIFTYVFYKIIDPGAINLILHASEEALLRRSPDMPDEQFEAAMNMTRRFMTPLALSITTFFNTAFSGVIFSLITSIFLKRKPKEEF